MSNPLRRRTVVARAARTLVDSLEPRRLLATITVTSSGDTTDINGSVTLREAIICMNLQSDFYDVSAVGAYGTNDTIAFNIGGGGGQVITVLNTDLPSLDKPVIVDGSTQPGYVGAPLIQIRNSGDVGVTNDGLIAGATDITIRGLSVTGFEDAGIRIDNDRVRVVGCWLGLNLDGVGGSANDQQNSIAAYHGENITIGGSNAVDRNILSNAQESAVYIGSGTTNVLVTGNWIGTSIDGESAAGSYAGVASDGLFTTISNNVISGNKYGVLLENRTEDPSGLPTVTITNNKIGTNPAGAKAIPNTVYGVWFRIVKKVLISKNLISGNGDAGVELDLSSDIGIVGNTIGLDVTGTTALPNGVGVSYAMSGSSKEIIGGPAIADRNVISGNALQGIVIVASTVTVMGNYIGTNAAGDAGVGNVSSGVRFDESDNGVVIGNLISGNGGDGIGINESDNGGFLIQGNRIGTNAAGTAAIPNLSDGIDVDQVDPPNPDSGASVTIGGTTPATRNLISGNLSDGIEIGDTDNFFISGNYIGTDVTGTLPLGNTLKGINVGQDTRGVIGGTSITQGNLIAYNGKAGVAIDDNGNASVRMNSIFGNVGLAIDIEDEGIDRNDVLDADSGANDEQNSPILISAEIAADGLTANVSGILSSEANSIFILDFYASDTAHISGSGDAKTYLGSTLVTTNSSGIGYFGKTLSAAGLAGKVIAATANTIDFVPYYRTSELSGPIDVISLIPPPPPVITIDDVTANEGQSGTTNFTFTLTRTGSLLAASTINFSTANGTATSGSDYTAASGTVSFAAGESSKQITIAVNGDTSVESSETFFVNLASPTGATIGDAQGVGTISNDDFAPPTLAINDVAKSEGNSGTTNFVFTVTRSGNLAGASSVKFVTASNSAVSGSDYDGASGTINFAPGQATATLTVNVKGDTSVESDEKFFVNLSAATGATIADSQGLGTINNDDVAPDTGSVSIITDPCDPSKTALRIVGTDNSDVIDVQYNGAQGKVKVIINGTNKGSFTFTGSILVYAKNGNDKVTIASQITRTTVIYGDAGNDSLYGGGGVDVLLGGTGNDKLVGNGARDILIGGGDADSLDGGSGEDLLLAGGTSYDGDLSALCKITKEWARTDKDYATRLNNLRNGGGFNGALKLNDSTVSSGASPADTLTGGADRDAFFANLMSSMGSVDKLTDKASNETVVQVS